jgi:hypothetical protein
MNVEEDSCFDSDESTAVSENDANFRDTFCQNPEDSKLQVTRFYDCIVDDSGNERPKYYVRPEPITFADEIEDLAVCLQPANLILCYSSH